MNATGLLQDGTSLPNARLALKQHPLSAAFPSMTDEDYTALKDSIEDIGVQNPVTLFEGMLLDGAHRYKAATELCLDCPTQEFGGDDPRAFVKAQNKTRRHLTAGQWALIEVNLWNWQPAHRPSKSVAPTDFRKHPKTAAELAELAGVSVKSIERAKAVASSGTDFVQSAVRTGLVPLERGAQISKLPKVEQAAAINNPVKRKQRNRRVTPIASTEQTEAEKLAEIAHGDESLLEIAQQQLKEIAELRALIAVAESDDVQAEAIKYKRIADVARARQNELMATVNQREEEIKRHVKALRRIGVAVGEADPNRVAAAVEAFIKKLGVAA